jgi:hypothetical protein
MTAFADITRPIDVEVEAMTLGQLETFEEITGTPVDKLNDPDQLKAKMIQAIVMISLVAQGVDVTLEDVKTLSLDDVNFVSEDDEEDPTDAA